MTTPASSEAPLVVTHPREQESVLSAALRQPLTLGLFLPIHKGGWTISAAPRGTDWQFPYNLALTQRAEALGFDLVFALAQWLPKGGMGGRIAYRDNSLDSFMTAAALTAATKRIMLISTVHVLYGIHPLFLARFGATLDHISEGRWGVNIVTGSRPEERVMFGLDAIEHDLRYEMIHEYADILTRLWGENENLTYDGRFWQTDGAYVVPRPKHARPIIVNAGNSPPSLKFAAKYSDFVFITSPGGAEFAAAIETLPALTAQIRAVAKEAGRTVRSIINPMIVCRETEAEAWQVYNDIIEQGDDEATKVMMAHRDSQSWQKHTHTQRIVGGNVHIVGSPEHVAESIGELKKAGCDGVQLSFFDFAPDLEFFGERVLPLLYDAGLRLRPAADLVPRR